MYLWVAYSKDEYELPFAVEDTCTELAKKLNMSYSSIVYCANNDKPSKEYKIVKLEIEGD